MARRRFPYLRVAIVLLALAETISAQVDQRVNRGDALGSGHARDQNPALGSGGANQAGPTWDQGWRANAIVTGNVTGLSSFHGETPVFQTNQFRVSLPTSSLSSFTARSFGASETSRAAPWASTYYYGRTETVPDLGYIRSGLTQPGSATLASPYTPPPMPSQVGRPLQPGDHDDLMKTLPDARVRDASYGRYQTDVRRSRGADDERLFASPFEVAAESSIFGTPFPPPPSVPVWRTPDALELPSGAGQARSPGVSPAGADQAAGDQLAPKDATSTVLTPGQAGSSLVAPASPVTAEGGYMRPGRDPVATPGLVPEQRAPSMGGQQAVPPGQATEIGGRFAEMYRAIAAAQQSGAAFPGFMSSDVSAKDTAAPEAGGEDAAVDDSDIAAFRQQQASAASLRRPEEAVAQLAVAARWAKSTLADPVSTFVGEHGDRMDKAMAQAEAALKDGRYYQGARCYDLAHAIDPRDPLPLLGRGHALIAAGDYVTASLALQRGIERFPQIAAFRLDLVKLVGGGDVYDRRRADLEDKLTQQEDYQLRFLLGYLELYSGLPEEGLADLERAAQSAPEGSIISLFRDLVLGVRPLPPLGRPATDR